MLVLLVVTVHGKPPTLDGHNFFVRTPFWMFLDSMESPLSLESIHIYLDKIETHIRSRNHKKIVGLVGFACSHYS